MIPLRLILREVYNTHEPSGTPRMLLQQNWKFEVKFLVLVFSSPLNEAVIMVISLELLIVKMQNLMECLVHTGFIYLAFFSSRDPMKMT